MKAVDWEILVNKRSTTWKQLPEKTRNGLTRTSAVDVLLANPTLVKRPVLEVGKGAKSQVLVGFEEKAYQAALK